MSDGELFAAWRRTFAGYLFDELRRREREATSATPTRTKLDTVERIDARLAELRERKRASTSRRTRGGYGSAISRLEAKRERLTRSSSTAPN